MRRGSLIKKLVAQRGGTERSPVLACPWGPVPWGHGQILLWSSFVSQPEFRERGFALDQREPGTAKYGHNDPGASVTHREPKK